MTDRIRSLTVVLEQDIREDDLQPLIDAMLHFRGVQSVTTHPVSPNDFATEERLKSAFRQKLHEVLR